jgi:hypothetical protein
VANNPVARTDPSGKHYVEREGELVLHTWCELGHYHDSLTGAWALCIPEVKWPCRWKCKLAVGVVLNAAELAALRGAGRLVKAIPFVAKLCGKQGVSYLICEEVCGKE